MASNKKKKDKERKRSKNLAKKKLNSTAKSKSSSKPRTLSATDLKVNEAIYAINADDFFKAEGILNEILKDNPKHPYANLYLGAVYYKRLDLFNAEKYMNLARDNGVDEESYCINYALVLEQRGDLDEALKLYEKALKLVPNAEELHYNLANLYNKKYDYQNAYTHYKQALKLSPADTNIEFQLGKSAHEIMNFEEAKNHLLNVIKKDPDNALAHSSLGMTLMRLQENKKAEEHLLKARELAPFDLKVKGIYGNFLREIGRAEEAAQMLQEVMNSAPDNIDSLMSYGNSLSDSGRYPEAREYFQKVMQIAPEYYASYASMGMTYSRTSSKTALEWYEKALAKKENADDVLSLMSFSLNQLGKNAEAEQCLRKAIKLYPDYAQHHQNLSNILLTAGKVRESLDEAIRANELNPDLNLVLSNIVFYMHYIPEYSSENIWKFHQVYRNMYPFDKTKLPIYNTEVDPDKKLRVGLVSCDFRKHSVAYFIEPILRGHDKNKYELICYADVKAPDTYTQHLREKSDGWRNTIGYSYDKLAETIRADGIDILIDLAGHTADNRLPTFAQKPAPVQVSWLGYPDTTGLEQMDYRLVDEFTDTPESEKYSSEALIRMPGGFHCYSALRDAPPVAPTPSKEKGHVTFGSFNNLAKVSDETIFLWCKILENVPGSELLMKSLSLGDESVQAYTVSRFKEFGIDESRLKFIPRTASVGEHLQNYALIDIALDTYPYNGTTTTFEALWMGVPVITLHGPNHCSRVGLSIMTQIGLAELTASNPEEFIGRAVGLADAEDIREQLRASMRERMIHSPFLDEKGFLGKFEATLSAIWKNYCEKKPENHKPKQLPEISNADPYTVKAPQSTASSLKLNFGNAAPQDGSMKLNFGTPTQKEDNMKLNFGDTAKPAPEQEMKLNFGNAQATNPDKKNQKEDDQDSMTLKF